jgi:hypothetical protein
VKRYDAQAKPAGYFFDGAIRAQRSVDRYEAFIRLLVAALSTDDRRAGGPGRVSFTTKGGSK